MAQEKEEKSKLVKARQEGPGDWAVLDFQYQTDLARQLCPRMSAETCGVSKQPGKVDSLRLRLLLSRRGKGCHRCCT